MSLSKVFPTYDQFWTAISRSVTSSNYPTYHPCCRVWVSRAQKACRDSHREKLSWGVAMDSVGGIHADAKAVLKAHMLEHGWGEPIRFNTKCSATATPAVLNQALCKCETPPAIQPFQEALHFSSHRPAPTSPRSSPAELQQVPPEYQLQPTTPANPPKPLLETESRAFNHSMQQSLQLLQEQQAQVQEGIANINKIAESNQQLAMQNQLALSTALMQITSALSLVQVRLDSLEKQVQTPARLTPCITEMRNLEHACQEAISQAHKDRDQMAARAADIERSNSRIFKSSQSIANHSEKQAQQLADSRSEAARLRQDLRLKEQQHELLKATTESLAKRVHSLEAQQRQRERRVQLLQPDPALRSAVEQDGYKIKKLPEATRKWHN